MNKTYDLWFDCYKYVQVVKGRKLINGMPLEIFHELYKKQLILHNENLTFREEIKTLKKHLYGK